MTVTITNAGIERQANRFARLLDAAGVPERGVVAALLPNVPEFMYVMRGATWSGRTFTPINWHLNALDVRYVLENSGAAAFVAHESFASTAASAADGIIPPAACFSVGGAIEGFRPLQAMSACPDAPLERPLAGNMMLYTSGTTGRPRGVKPADPAVEPPPCMLSRMGMQMISGYIGEAAREGHLVATPLYHAGPLTYAEGAALLGADLTLMDRWDPEEFLRLIEEKRIRSTFLVPTHFVRLLRLPEAVRSRYDLGSLRMIAHGAAPVAVEVKRRMIEWLGPILFEFYGGTEGGGTSISSPEWLAHPGSVGRPYPGLSVHILDEARRPCPPRTVGDVYFFSAALRFEYRNDPEKTAAAYHEGMYTLGDVGWLDEEGYLYLCDRKADTIISGGVNVYPAEVEAVLLGHPRVEDCCVIGLPDEEWGEVVLAVVQTSVHPAEQPALEDDLTVLCRGRLGTHQLPRSFVFTSALPRSATGKLPRKDVRDDYRRRFS